MTLTDIALLNLRRRKAKAAFVVAGLLVGVATVVGLVSLTGALTDDINHKLEQYGANILIVPKTENLSLSYGGLSLGGVSFAMEELRQADLEKIAVIPNAGNVAAVGPMVLGVIEVAGEAGVRKALLTGVDFQVAPRLKPWWKVRGELPAADQVLLGAEAAHKLGLGVGDVLSTAGRQLPVAGVLEATGSQDDQLVYAHLVTAQVLLGKEGQISMAEVAALCKDCPIDDMVSQIGAVLPGAEVMAIQQVVKGRMEAIGHFRNFSLGVSALVVLVGGLVVLVTMMGSVRERTAEIGIFRAIGFRRSHVMRVVLVEAAVVSLVAGVLGYLAGWGGARLILPVFTRSWAVGMHGAGHAIAVPWQPELAAVAVAASLLLGLLASLYPALVAAKLDPNEALRAL